LLFDKLCVFAKLGLVKASRFCDLASNKINSLSLVTENFGSDNININMILNNDIVKDHESTF